MPCAHRLPGLVRTPRSGSVSTFVLRHESRDARRAPAGATRGPNVPTWSRNSRCVPRRTRRRCTPAGAPSVQPCPRRATMPKRSSSAATSRARASLHVAKYTRAEPLAPGGRTDAAIGRPQMPQAARRPGDCRGDARLGQALLVRTLAVHAECLRAMRRRRSHTSGAVAGDDELMPCAATGMTRDVDAQRVAAHRGRSCCCPRRRSCSASAGRAGSCRRPPDVRAASRPRRATDRLCGLRRDRASASRSPMQARRPASSRSVRAVDARR